MSLPCSLLLLNIITPIEAKIFAYLVVATQVADSPEHQKQIN